METINITSSLNLLSKNRTAIMGFAILWIMFFHLPFEIDSIKILGFIKNAGYSGVDIFFFLSGFGLYFSVTKETFTLKEYYKRRFARIMPEFWLVLTIIFVVNLDFSVTGVLDYICKATTLGYWLPWLDMPYFLWYISAIMMFYAIYPICFLNNNSGLKVSIIAICIGFVLTIIYAFISVFVFNNERFGDLIILTISRIPIFFIGSMFGYWMKSNQKITMSKITIGLIIIMAIISVIFLAISVIYFKDYLWTCSLYFIPFIFITPVLCVLLAHIFNLSRRLNSIFAFFGVFSLELFLCHASLYKLIVLADTTLAKIIVCGVSVILSFVCARLLYYINNRYIQKIFK